MTTRPLIPLAAAWLSGIVWGHEFPEHFLSLSFLLSLSILGLGIGWPSKRKTAIVLALAPIFFHLGCLAIASRINPTFPENHITKINLASTFKIFGVVETAAEINEERQKIILRSEFMGDQREPVVGRLSLTILKPQQPLQTGDRIAVAAKLRKPRNFHNPGAFDYVRYLGYQDVWVTGYADYQKVVVLQTAAPAWFQQQLAAFRANIKASFDERLSGVPKAILAALILGDKSLLSDAEREKFSRLGISHLLAISGLHIGIVAFLSFAVLVRFFSLFPILTWNAWTRKAAAVCSAFPVLFYGVLTGMPISTQRAVIMVFVFLGAILLKRENDVPSSLAAACLIILILDPTALFSISFQLSFVSVFSILYGMSATETRKETVIGIKQKALAKIWTIFRVSLFAALGTYPLVAYYFHSISLISPLANCVFVPLIGSLVVPIGLLAATLQCIHPTVSAWMLDAASLALTFSVKLIDQLAQWPFIARETTTPTMLEITCYYTILWSGVYYLGCRLRTAQPDQQPLSRKIAIWIMALGMMIWGIEAGYRFQQRFWGRELSATIIDVGQGSANVIILPNGKTILIDGGGFFRHEAFDVGKQIVSPALRKMKIKAFDLVILTHPDGDHLNGLFYIAQRYPIKEFWGTGDSQQHQRYASLLENLAQQGVHIADISTMPRTRQSGKVEISILYPPKDYLIKKNQDRWRNNNNNSLVVRLAYGTTSILFTGDIMKMAEIELSALHKEKLNSDILVAPHHGSRTSGTESFLKWVEPKIVLISCGWQNRFSYPHPEALKRYSKNDRRIYRTDESGALTLISDGESWRVRPHLNNVP